MRAFLAIGIALGLMVSAPALAGDRIPLLIHTVELDGTQTFWWACDGRPTAPLVSRLGEELRNKHTTVVDSCTGLTRPIHRSYQRATLREYQLYNLANSLQATRVVAGRIQVEKGPVLTDLGLHSVTVTITLSSHHVRAEQKLATVKVRGAGYARTVSEARAQADRVALLKLKEHLPTLFAQKKRTQTPRFRVQVDGLPTPGFLSTVMDTLNAVPGVTHVVIDELKWASAVLQILPMDARPQVTSMLHTMAPDVLVTIIP